MKSNISHLRQNYSLNELNENEIGMDPFLLFDNWFKNAKESGVLEPNAMAVSTFTNQKVHSRILLLKDYSSRGFSFFTNYDSNKGKQLAKKPFASILFFWDKLERQIRIEGKIKKLSSKESNEYFQSRPVESQIGAWTSEQSKVIPSREVLEERFSYYKKKFEGKKISKPKNWGGYILIPESFEFWQGRPSRLHDRIEFIRSGQKWSRRRLSP
jgi:pyridoxamine 5'-phosphate oxidase